jgi:hypothetical protein
MLRRQAADFNCIVKIAYNRRQKVLTVCISQCLRLATAHSGDQGIRSTQINANGQPMLMRFCGLAGF